MTPEEETFNKLQEPAPEIDEHGNKRWYKEGIPHRENDLPAIVWNDGEQWWYKNGKRHRENAPAVVYSDGNLEFWKNGKFIK